MDLPTSIEAAERDGVVVVGSTLDAAALARLDDAFEAAWATAAAPERRAGVRRALAREPALREALDSVAARLADALLGSGWRVVRALLFDKTPAANWPVPWHRDTTIAVRERRETPGFGPWSVRDGVPHVRPPLALLASMLTVRLHLDDADADNGALRVVPGSHVVGDGWEEVPGKPRAGARERLCAARRGELLLFRPLLLHASRRSRAPRRRRVIHLELSATALPDGLEWAELS